MSSVQQELNIHAPAVECFSQWVRFEEFPRFMKHVKSIRKTENKQWRWVVDGPMGAPIEWEAVMEGRPEEQIIAWHTIEPEENKENEKKAINTIANRGAVRFEALSPNLTHVTVTLQYDPPAGVVGETLGHIFSNPEHMVKDCLHSFKNLMEEIASSNQRSAKITG